MRIFRFLIKQNYLENPGYDPGTSRMQSGLPTIWANTPDETN